MKARSQFSLVAVALLVVLMVTSLVLPTAAQGPRPTREGGLDGLTREPLSRDVIENTIQTAARTPDGRIKVILTLSQPPAGKAFAQAGGRLNKASADAAAAAATSAIRAEQTTFTTSARMLGAQVLSSTQFAVNTVTVAVKEEGLSSLWALPGVRAITPVRIVERNHTTSVPLISVPNVWDSDFEGTGYTGAGVTIAIIDDGIDYTHYHFGGDGNFASNDLTDGIDYPGWPPVTLPVSAGDQKVIGGTDLVGDDYDAAGDGAELIPVPDDDPSSCAVVDGGGHGTHVAGTAAGWGVVPDGLGGYETYTGGYDNGLDLFPQYPNGDVTNWHIGPGVAPEAYLVAIRVFGCSGSTGTDVLLDALELAGTITPLGETVDVINMSLGSSYGGAGDDDPLIAAQETLIDAGIVIVDSAGNSGNYTLVSGAPGSSPGVISVANITDGSVVVDVEVELTVGTGAPATFAAVNSAYGQQSFSVTGEVVAAIPFDACTALSNAAALNGKIALVVRGTCNFVVKSEAAINAGALGVIIVNNSPAAPTAAGGEPTPTLSSAPTVMVSQAAGTILASAGLGNSVTLTSGVLAVAPDQPSRIVSSSSRGGAPRGTDGNIVFKPNISAPGDSIASAGSGTDWDMYVIGGTSMASPHVAGVAALLLESDSTLTPQEVKAAIMNTALQDTVRASLPANDVLPPQRVGAGQVDAVLAVTAAGDHLAYATQNPKDITLSFGYPKVLLGSPLNDVRTVTVVNNTASEVNYDISLLQRSDMANVNFNVPTSVTVPANSSTTFDVTLVANPGAGPSNIITYDYDGGSTSQYFNPEESAIIQLTATAGHTLYVPVYAAPHVVGNTTPMLFADVLDDLYYIEFSGQGAYSGGSGYNTNTDSWVSVLELAAIDPVDAPVNYVPRPGDAYPQDDGGYDIAVIGITTDEAFAPAVDAAVYFGIGLHSEFTSVRDAAYQIAIDADQDGVEDYVVYNSQSVSNQYVSVFADINNYLGGGSTAAYTDYFINGASSAFIPTMPFKNNVLVIPLTFGFWNQYLPVSKRITGEFNYWVEVYSRDSDFEVRLDSVGSSAEPLTYNPFEPAWYIDALVAGSMLSYGSAGDFVYLERNPAFDGDLPDLLVLNHVNQTPESRIQIVEAPKTGDFDLLSPANGTYFRNADDIDTFTWEVPADGSVSHWRFVLTQLSTNTRLGTVYDISPLTAAAGDDELTCDETVCTLDFSGAPLLDDGQYAWTVTNYVSDEQEASNAPFFFTVESNDINLITNGGFEACTSGNAAGWSGPAKCKVNATKAHSGDGFFQGKKNQFDTQVVTTHPAAASLGAGDELTLGGWFNAKAAAKKVFTAIIKYNDTSLGNNGKVKVNIKVTATTAGYENLEESYVLLDTVKNIKVKLGSKTAKVLADDVYLLASGINGAAGRGGAIDGILPPPAAPEGFRGTN